MNFCFVLCSIFKQVNTLTLASFMGLLIRSNDQFVWIKALFLCSPSRPICSVLVHKPNTDFGYDPRTQQLLVFSIPVEGALHEYR